MAAIAERLVELLVASLLGLERALRAASSLPPASDATRHRRAVLSKACGMARRRRRQRGYRCWFTSAAPASQSGHLHEASLALTHFNFAGCISVPFVPTVVNWRDSHRYSCAPKANGGRDAPHIGQDRQYGARPRLSPKTEAIARDASHGPVGAGTPANPDLAFVRARTAPARRHPARQPLVALK
jgi:hypothetical protein